MDGRDTDFYMVEIKLISSQENLCRVKCLLHNPNEKRTAFALKRKIVCLSIFLEIFVEKYEMQHSQMYNIVRQLHPDWLN